MGCLEFLGFLGLDDFLGFVDVLLFSLALCCVVVLLLCGFPWRGS